jgi:hypothetical protein
MFLGLSCGAQDFGHQNETFFLSHAKQTSGPFTGKTGDKWEVIKKLKLRLSGLKDRKRENLLYDIYHKNKYALRLFITAAAAMDYHEILVTLTP